MKLIVHQIETKSSLYEKSLVIIDLAFFIAGKPKVLKSFSRSGRLDWHEKTNFVGAGETEKDVLFSYLSNWESAGRWGIELLTYSRRIYLKPMENLHIQKKGSVEVLPYEIDLSLDIDFKPGLYLQVKEFLSDFKNRLPSIKEHIFNSKNIYSFFLK